MGEPCQHWKVASDNAIDLPCLVLADSPYCSPPQSASKKSGLVSAVARAAKSSKRSSNGDVKSSGGSAHFAFQLDFPVNYPFKAPKITVLSNSYHPNINTNTGEICDNMLTGEGWSPTINVRVGVVLVVCALT